MESIADKKKWQESTTSWVAGLYSRSTDHDFRVAIARYMRLYPLPVGRRSLRQPLWFGNPDTIDGLMPFIGDEFAACIMLDRIKDTTIEAFGLCRLEGRDDRLHMAFRTTPMQFRLTGPNPAHQDVTARCIELKASWSKLVGISIPLGRPAGRTITRKQVVDAFNALAPKGWGPIPEQWEVAEVLDVNARTVRNVLQESGESWKSFVRAVTDGD